MLQLDPMFYQIDPHFGHTLNALISSCHPEFVRDVSVGMFISDYAVIRKHRDSPLPPHH